MTITVSTKLRAIGGASIIALASGFTGIAPAAANAPAPVGAVPTPTIPTAPDNVQECALDNVAMPNTIVCAPGTDPDGITEALDDVVVTVETGAQVQGEINLLDGANATVDGDIVVTGNTESALELGAAASVVNNGFIGRDPTWRRRYGHQ